MLELITGLVLFTAAFVHGIAGFAFALLAVPLLAFFWPLRFVVPLLAFLGAVLNGILLFFLRRHFYFRRIQSLLLGALPGVWVGVEFLQKAPEDLLRLLLGFTLVLYGSWGLMRPKVSGGIKDYWGYFFGFLAGALGAALNTPGPPVVIYVTLKGWPKEEVKSTLQGYFLLLLVLIIGAHWWEGLLTGKVWGSFWLYVPVTLLGLYLGHYWSKYMSLTLYLRLLYALLILAGFLNLAKILNVLN